MGGHAWLDGRLLRDPRHGAGPEALRLYCRLENGSPQELAERGFNGPQIVVINGLVKPNATLFSDADYKRHVRQLGDDYLSKLPRPIAEPEEADG